ncbi:MAG: hypothetical protein ACJAZX_001368 [Rickettsiales bacterium]|jgi:hypothetical protein
MMLFWDRRETKKQLIYAALLAKHSAQTMRIGIKNNVDLCNGDLKEIYQKMIGDLS